MNENNFSGGSFDFIQQDDSGRGYRFGFVIAIADGKGGKKRCPYVIDYVIDLARRSRHRLMIRLVMG